MIRKYIPARVITLYHFNELTEQAQRQAVINFHNIDDEFIENWNNNELQTYIDCDCGADGWSVLYPLWKYIQETNMPFIELDRDIIKIEEYYPNVYSVFLNDIYIYDIDEEDSFIKYWLEKSGIKIKYGLRQFYFDCIQGIRIDEEGAWIELNCDSFYDEKRKRIIKYIINVSNQLETFITKNFIEVVNERMTDDLRGVAEYYLYNYDEVLEEVIFCNWLPQSDKSLFLEDGTLYEKGE